MSDLSVDDDNDKVALLKDRLMDDKDARVRLSVCSNASENDETLILPNYNGYNNEKQLNDLQLQAAGYQNDSMHSA